MIPDYLRDKADTIMTKDRYLVQCGTARNVISYAAFYGDCLHEIEPVTMGMRLTLSYQLVRVSSEEGQKHIQPYAVPSDPVDANMITVPRFIHDPELAEITRLMQVKPLELDRTTFMQTFSTAVLKYLTIASNRYGTTLSDMKLELLGYLTHLPDLKRLPMPPLPAIDTTLALSRTDGLRKALIRALLDKDLAGKTIGFPCYHLYECKERPHLRDVCSVPLSKRIHSLRGADALLGLVGLQCGLLIQVKYIVTMNSDKYAYTSKEQRDDAHGCYHIVHIVETLPAINSPLYEKINTSNYEYGTDEYKEIHHWIKDHDNDREVPRMKIADAELSKDGYFGNEAVCGYVYAQCAIVIEIPAWTSVARLRILESLLSDATQFKSDDLKDIPIGLNFEKEFQAAAEAFKYAHRYSY